MRLSEQTRKLPRCIVCLLAKERVWSHDGNRCKKVENGRSIGGRFHCVDWFWCQGFWVVEDPLSHACASKIWLREAEKLELVFKKW